MMFAMTDEREREYDAVLDAQRNAPDIQTIADTKRLNLGQPVEFSATVDLLWTGKHENYKRLVRRELDAPARGVVVGLRWRNEGKGTRAERGWAGDIREPSEFDLKRRVSVWLVAVAMQRKHVMVADSDIREVN